jgi:hypothetical protein
VTLSRNYQTVSRSSTLAIWLHSKAHSFRFLRCPADFLRVGRLHTDTQKVLEAFTGRNRLLWCAPEQEEEGTGHALCCQEETANRPGKSGSLEVSE